MARIFAGMKGGARFSFAGIAVLLALAGCGRSFLHFGEERAPWRHEAEVACLKSGTVKLGAGIVQIKPIEGPGVCGADFPLKVAAIGETVAMSYADDDPRPPARIPGSPAGQPRWPASEPRYAPGAAVRPVQTQSLPAAPMQPAQGRMRWESGPPGIERPQTTAPNGAPISLNPPGVAPPADDIPDDAELPPGRVAPAYPRTQPAYNAPVERAPPRALPALGPMRGPNAVFTAAVVTPPATLACPLVSALERWIAEGVQPAALHWFGTPVTEIKQISSYSCREMVGSGTSTISEHAFGNALDVAGFTFADGRKVTVKDGWHGTPEEQGFLHDVQLYACQTFNTVLAPGYNVYHYNHIHVDLMRRANGHYPCRPDAITGEVAAAKARAVYASKHRALSYTGSLPPAAANGRLPAAITGTNADRGAAAARGPRAIAGADGEDESVDALPR